ncbi:extracellular solute-binding protein [Streptomyces sp. NPDC005908]|uniref:extracellular solute-binding protein n=1 Tax=unclassified Streptomyces TaxID=2593676 RepID=UPI0011A9F64E|nr:extracellular solute-binding protein [Streptomyces sp. T12]TWD18731.1 carbohydrate ABC transporter substrate-binding protein (CUT1 family) [Streptomyces sp. T12]
MALSRRTLLGLAAAVPVSAALTACGGSSGPGKSSGATYWYLNGQPQEGVRAGAVDAFNKAHPDTQIDDTTYQNDAYKTKIKTAIGAGKAPTIIWGWGGGTLRAYAEAGQVEDLTPWFDEHPDVKKGLFPSSFGAATVDGKIYAMPSETVQPIILYYNRKVFDQVGVEPPETWDDIMALVPRFNAKGVAPFALGGQSRWTNMMWLEFLFDRIGGPEVFQAAIEGEKNAWSHPDAIKALTALQDLVKADGFVKGFSSITADSNADQALLYTGRAAMMLHGAWSYGIQQADGGDFVPSGSLGFMNFPAVDGGKGDLSNTVGNPAQYLSISSKASAEEKKVAREFFATGILQEEEVKSWIGNGSVPIRLGTEKLLAASDNAEFLQFTYDLASKAKVFVQSWDQALSPTAAETLLDNIVKLFQLSISPQQFASNLNAVTGA